jgi:hydrogenase maturation protein HypF
MSFLRKQESIIKNSPVPEVAPGNPYLGIMLPYTPLHHLLMKELNSPVIATSGNLSEEPICINESEAYEKLKNIADYFLVHDRPIVRHVDDSIVRIIAGRPMVMRRARGYAPLPIQIEDNNNDSQMLAVGGHLKNTIALKSGKNVFISQHIGDLSTNEAYQTFQKVIQDFQLMYGIPHPKIICDSHPEYLSHKFAKELQKDSFEIQHHIAHVASCRAENYITGNALGVAFDGTGFGFDGSIWGGEFFLSTDNTFKHVAQFRQFPLPGGEIAIKEPRRSALGMLYEIYGERLFDINGNSHLLKGRLIGFTTDELKVLHQLLVKKVNAPITSSVGRIFDAVASMLDLTQISNYEAQAAMLVEFAADYSTHLYKEAKKEFYKFNIIEKNILYIDWQPMVEEILEDKSNNINVSSISQKFHNTICRIILDIAERIGENKIILSGGCFQNAILTENTIKLLQENNFSVYWHQRIPPNDGGISLGQIAAANILEK